MVLQEILRLYNSADNNREDSILLRADDNALACFHQEGNDEAFALLVRRHLSGVYSYAYHLTKNSALAEDISQETFIKAWKKINSYNAEKSFKAWLFSIAHNTAIDFLRHEKDFVFSDFDKADEENPILRTLVDDTQKTPHELLLAIENSHALSQALERLEGFDRAVITLHYNEGFTFAQIGEILTKPQNTVKSRHYRAIKMLEALLVTRD